MSKLLDAFLQLAQGAGEFQPPPANSLRPESDILQALQDLLRRAPAASSNVGTTSNNASSHCMNCCAPLRDDAKPQGLCHICDHTPSQNQQLLGDNFTMEHPPGQGTWAAALAQQAGGTLQQDASSSRRVAVVSDERMLLHRAALPPHFERPERLQAIWHRLATAGLLQRCQLVASREATEQELLAVHTQRLVDSLAATALHEHTPAATAPASGAQQHKAEGGESSSSSSSSSSGGSGTTSVAKSIFYRSVNERFAPAPILRTADSHPSTVTSNADASAAMSTATATSGAEPLVVGAQASEAPQSASRSDETSKGYSSSEASDVPDSSAVSTTSVSSYTEEMEVLSSGSQDGAPGPSTSQTSAQATPPGLETLFSFMRQGFMVSDATFQAARLAAGSAAQLATMLVRREADSGVAIVRPPGHHASADEAHGGCYFNSVAVAARAAQAAGAAKVMILDWGVHHGRGTQRIFAKDSSVLYMSMHRVDQQFYPADESAAMDEIGSGKGMHYTVNLAWPAPDVTDGDCINAMLHVVLPTANTFQPDLIIISAGFDAAEGEIMGGCSVTAPAYGHMLSLLQPLAPTMLVLEGGYNLEGTSRCVETCVRVLLGERPPRLPTKLQGSDAGWAAVLNALQVHGSYWEALHPISLDGWSQAIRKAQQQEKQRQVAAMRQRVGAVDFEEAEEEGFVEQQVGEYADQDEENGTRTSGR